MFSDQGQVNYQKINSEIQIFFFWLFAIFFYLLRCCTMRASCLPTLHISTFVCSGMTATLAIFCNIVIQLIVVTPAFLKPTRTSKIYWSLWNCQIALTYFGSDFSDKTNTYLQKCMCNDSVSKNFEEIFEDIQGPSLAEIG